MSDFKTGDETLDIEFENGDLVLTQGADAVKQSIRQRLNMFLAEWFLDLDAGVPYYQEILKKNPNPSLIEGILKNCILETPGVIELLSFSLDYAPGTRQLTCSFSAKSYDGPIDFYEIIGEAA